MIVRCWSGRVPLERGEDFRDHLVATGVNDFRAQPGCVDVSLWRQEEGEWTIFTFVSTWRDMASLQAHVGADATSAVLYPGDEAFGLVPDLTVTHHELIACGR